MKTSNLAKQVHFYLFFSMPVIASLLAAFVIHDIKQKSEDLAAYSPVITVMLRSCYADEGQTDRQNTLRALGVPDEKMKTFCASEKKVAEASSLYKAELQRQQTAGAE
ncbi:hypothetical protein ACFOY8_14745 [Thalassospira xianhensis]|nr:hypothetical protein [Thalassospira xianhensis]